MLITVAVAVLVIAFGRVLAIPMPAAARNPESSAIKTARVSLVISAVFAPMMWITKALAKVILKLIGIDPDKELNAVTEEEILMMSDEGAEKALSTRTTTVSSRIFLPLTTSQPIRSARTAPMFQYSGAAMT